MATQITKRENQNIYFIIEAPNTTGEIFLKTQSHQALYFTTRLNTETEEHVKWYQENAVFHKKLNNEKIYRINKLILNWPIERNKKKEV